MRIVPKVSVRMSLALTILLTIALSWILSTGIANYLNYLNMRELHQQMVVHPVFYPRPIQEPKFGLREFFTGHPPIRGGRGHRLPSEMRPNLGPAKRPRPGPEIPGMGQQFGGPEPGIAPDGPPPAPFELRWLLLRLVISFGLAIAAALWLGRQFTRPLMQLARGAAAFHSGDFKYRIPAKGKNEFAAVAAAMNDMAQQVSEHINKLEMDAERRRQFLADIAHEFRSPVATMRTMAGALQDGVAEEPERKAYAVSALVATSERLLRLVQDLMELAKLDLDEFPLNARQIDLQELVESAVQSHDAETAASGITLHPVESIGAVRITVDPDRIIQVLDNIIENAISYAGKGSEVRVSLKDGDPVKISISDTGKGIPASHMPYVLGPFFRADAARTPGDCHSGLGLSIACKLIEAHGGSLTITSNEGRGTRVDILIPKLSNRKN